MLPTGFDKYYLLGIPNSFEIIESLEQNFQNLEEDGFEVELSIIKNYFNGLEIMLAQANSAHKTTNLYNFAIFKRWKNRNFMIGSQH